jgi:hypothetical protein
MYSEWEMEGERLGGDKEWKGSSGDSTGCFMLLMQGTQPCYDWTKHI